MIACLRRSRIGEKPIGLEQPDAEDERERDPTLRRPHDARLRLERADGVFEGLQPLVRFSDNQKTGKVELHLVVGPLPNEAAAVQLCSALAASRILCQPAMYDGHRMALR